MNNKYKILNFEILNINIGNKKVIVELIFQNIGIINQKINLNNFEYIILFILT
jgi:hypothetical protein